MAEIVLSTEQASVVANAESEVFVRDAHGLLVGRIVNYATREQVENARRVVASGGETKTTSQIWQRITARDPS